MENRGISPLRPAGGSPPGKKGAPGSGPLVTEAKGSPLAVAALLLLPSLALAGADAARRWRERVMPRRDPDPPFEELRAVTSDGVALALRRIPGGGEGAVIVAHAAVTGQRYSPLVSLAEMLAAHFDVYTFDFRGHGASGGRLELNLGGPLEDMRTVVSKVREAGHAWVGAVGFSLGGMSVFLHAATCDGLDAAVVVGAPPQLPDVTPYRRLLPAWSLFLRFLGARFRAVNPGGPLPMEAAEDFPAVPLLVIHGENEAFYSRDDLERMLEKLGNRAELWVIDGAGHAELAGREADLVEWLLAHRRGPS